MCQISMKSQDVLGNKTNLLGCAVFASNMRQWRSIRGNFSVEVWVKLSGDKAVSIGNTIFVLSYRESRFEAHEFNL